jgi:hypothetical protein
MELCTDLVAAASGVATSAELAAAVVVALERSAGSCIFWVRLYCVVPSAEGVACEATSWQQGVFQIGGATRATRADLFKSVRHSTVWQPANTTD